MKTQNQKADTEADTDTEQERHSDGVVTSQTAGRKLAGHGYNHRLVTRLKVFYLPMNPEVMRYSYSACTVVLLFGHD